METSQLNVASNILELDTDCRNGAVQFVVHFAIRR